MDAPRYRTTRELWTHLLVYPGHTLPTAIAPIFIGVGLAIHDGVFAFTPALMALLCSWMIHVGGVFADNYVLLTQHAEVREHPELSDAVIDGTLKLPTLKLATIGWFAGSLIPGFYLFTVVGPWAIPLGVIGIGASAGYAVSRGSTSNLGVSDPVFVVMFGTVAVAGTWWVQARSHGVTTLPPEIFYLGLPMGLLVTNVMVIDDIRDVAFDQVKGWKTPAVRFGVRASKLQHLVSTVLAYAALVGFAFLRGPWLLLPMFTLPWAALVELKVWNATSREQLIPWTPRSAFLGMTYSALLAVALAMPTVSARVL